MLYYYAPRSSSLPALLLGLLVDLLPAAVGLLVGEVAAGLAAVLLHASKLIYPSIRQLRPFRFRVGLLRAAQLPAASFLAVPRLTIFSLPR